MLSTYASAFELYGIEKSQEYINLSQLFYELSVFIINDYDFILNKSDFEVIKEKYCLMPLLPASIDYFTLLNGVYPFQSSGTHYYASVPLLYRYAYQYLYKSLLRLKKFQIRSGFIFEEMVSGVLGKYGFDVKKIKRIQQKEFDVITVKDECVYNFQCKNNIIDVMSVGVDYKIIGRLNRFLCRYYEKSLIKEEDRSDLILSELNLQNIKHFVVSRYPVITRNFRIINYRELEGFIKKERYKCQ